MIRLAGLALVLLMLTLRPLWAQPEPLPGQDDPAFTAALDDWLADDEAAALPAFAELAQQDNGAARLLLALIDKSPELQGPWLSSRTRADRIALMRAPGGMSGQSWIHPLAETSPLAAAWQSLWNVDAPLSLITDFAAMGEDRAARAAVAVLAARERRGFAALDGSPGYPDGLRYFIWREWVNEPGHLARLTDAVLSLAPGDPQRVMMGETVAPEAYGDWLMSAPEAGAVAGFCAARCPQTARACALAAAEALGDPLLVMIQGSPAETLIPSPEFTESPRGQAALLRRVLLGASTRMRPAMLSRAATRDSCFADALAAEAARY
ncbi:hypothetical protein ACFQXB_05875 [Plastorhodobacter daqingensis]|uniref:Uncharacterized protein n=1 Tax=Plastorhodobacter daqingensis TaxID=1387281 RepID=A0ABW2UGC4_9RHOB